MKMFAAREVCGQGCASGACCACGGSWRRRPLWSRRSWPPRRPAPCCTRYCPLALYRSRHAPCQHDGLPVPKCWCRGITAHCCKLEPVTCIAACSFLAEVPQWYSPWSWPSPVSPHGELQADSASAGVTSSTSQARNACRTFPRAATGQHLACFGHGEQTCQRPSICCELMLRKAS